MKALPIQNWASYVPDGNLDTLRKSLNSTIDPKLPAQLIPVTQSQVKATTDVTFVSMNQAAVNLIRQSSGKHADVVVDKFEQQHQNDQHAKYVAKQEKKKAKKKRLVPEESTVAVEPTITTSEKKHKSVPPVTSVDELPIETLEQHNRRDDQLSLFALNMKRIAKPLNDIIINTPPATAVMAYCAKYKSEFPWFAPMHNLVASSDTYDYPDVPVIAHATLVNFLREPDRRMPFERPCFNLDREPHKHEVRLRCVAHRISEERLGKGKGYRLRELLMPDTQTKIYNAMEHGKDPSIHLGPIPELCYLCHLWTTLHDCTYQRDKADERLRKDMTDDTNPNVVIINKFMVSHFFLLFAKSANVAYAKVDIDKPGEYDRTKMLASDKISMGIWGPFPLFNECNYVCSVKNGLRCFDETDNLLFRLTRVSLPRIESLNQKDSVRSNPTLAALVSSHSHH